MTDAAGNAQTLPSSNLAMYEQLRQHCPAPLASADPAYSACAAGVYVGRDLRDGTTVCTVKLTKDGEVTFTVGDTVNVYRMTEYFRYSHVNPAVEGTPYLSTIHISGYSAEDAARKVHGFALNVRAKGDGSTRPDDFEITYTYGDGITADSRTICKMPL